MQIVYKGDIVLKDEVLYGGYVCVENGVITYVGKQKPNCDCMQNLEGYIIPGFIDIHCHAGATCATDEDPYKVAEYHKEHGTTSMLLTYYRKIPHDKLLDCLGQVKKMVDEGSNVVGAHLEGPIVNANLGAGMGYLQDYPEKEKYTAYINSGVVKQWTSAPEIDGVLEMIKDMKNAGIAPAIGHSKASYKQVVEACKAGAKIVTHIFDATGTTKDKSTMLGTQDVSFDEACMLMDDLFYEVICDKNWVHVKKEKLALLVKTVGIDKIVAITDSFTSDGNEESDINVYEGKFGLELTGSKLTMDGVCVNLFNAGYTPIEVSKMTSYNASRAIGLLDRGEIAVGKKADLLHVDSNMKLIKVL
ncbi:MAG: amidohydrolase family protein [Clostridia bacterium]|nr:amidohydrolase family protein [Clostridia bacterium]